MVKDQAYPLDFAIQYPIRGLSRLSTLSRAILVLPIVIVAATLQGAGMPQDYLAGFIVFLGTLSGLGIVVVPVVLMLLFRGKYPRWWFDWNLELMRFVNRILVYLLLMTDRYPSTDDQQSIRLDIDHPLPGSLNRGLPLVKWLLAAPHYFALALLMLGVVAVLPVVWLIILVSGSYPKILFSYSEGALRWLNRVSAYSYALFTDEYPPFRLSP